MASLPQTTAHQPNDRPSNARTSAPENSPAVPRDTGFHEPLSKLSNTTLPHKDALRGAGEELDMSVIAKGKHHRHPTPPGLGNRHHDVGSIEAQMYNDLDMVDADDYEKSRQEGKFKKILHKLAH
ncbi:hypothetical protein BGX38DRAFT_1138224 [Terfezia claveryi]|nr:hypothetical protein BGX38DRAFT_1138224 [Terfezia claveryi]